MGTLIAGTNHGKGKPGSSGIWCCSKNIPASEGLSERPCAHQTCHDHRDGQGLTVSE
jgi:hypothetical protein